MRPPVAAHALGRHHRDGCIAMVPGARGVTPSLGAAALVEAVPQLSEIVAIATRTFRLIPSPEITIPDLFALAGTVERAVAAGARVMLSNADTPLVRRLYRGGNRYALHEATAPRPINSRAAGRGAVAELIIATYG